MQEHPHARPLPISKQMAAMVGLEDLQVGKHWLRDSQRARIGSINVVSFWKIEIFPSFHTQSVLACVEVKGEVWRGTQSSGGIKAVYATPDHAAVLPLETDPIAEASRGIDLLAPLITGYLDGIGYRFTFATWGLQGEMKFANPRNTNLIRLENAALDLGRRIASQSEKVELIAAIDVWTEYVHDRQGERNRP